MQLNGVSGIGYRYVVGVGTVTLSLVEGIFIRSGDRVACLASGSATNSGAKPVFLELQTAKSGGRAAYVYGVNKLPLPT